MESSHLAAHDGLSYKNYEANESEECELPSRQMNLDCSAQQKLIPTVEHGRTCVVRGCCLTRVNARREC